MSDQNTTRKSITALVPTDLQQARNALAVAIKNHTSSPTEENRQAVLAAQAAVFTLEDHYRGAYKLLLEHQCAKQRRP